MASAHSQQVHTVAINHVNQSFVYELCFKTTIYINNYTDIIVMTSTCFKHIILLCFLYTELDSIAKSSLLSLFGPAYGS